MISEVKPYPNPCAYINGGLNISYNATRATAYTVLYVYTPSFRLVLKLTDGADRLPGSCLLQVPAGKLSKLGRGTYYAVLEAKADNGDLSRGPVFVFVVN